MFSVIFYKAMHLTGLFMAFMGLAVLALGPEPSNRRRAIIFHGIGLTLALVGGFGMAGKLGMMASFPAWLLVKTVLWLLLGALPVLMRRIPAVANMSWWALPLVVVIAAWLALYKPF